MLDPGCNAGYWSLLAAEAHADFVLGIDAREVHIEQANLVFEAKGVDRSRYRFEQGNVFAHRIEERFDIALCLGLLDHVAKPVELFALMTRAAELIVLDTEISRAKESAFDVTSLLDPDSVVDHEMVLIPSRQAIYDLAGEFAMAAVPLALNMTDYSGLLDSERGRRLAFICSASTALSVLDAEKRPPLLPWWVSTLLPRRSRRGS